MASAATAQTAPEHAGRMSATVAPGSPPEHTIGTRLAGRLADLAEQVRRLDPPARRDPEKFWRDKSELAAQIVALGQDAARRLGSLPP